jgi:hypothetical protein
VLLDHGLYKELPDQLRLDYASLWKALVLKDLPGVKYYCQKLNAGRVGGGGCRGKEQDGLAMRAPLPPL